MIGESFCLIDNILISPIETCSLVGECLFELKTTKQNDTEIPIEIFWHYKLNYNWILNKCKMKRVLILSLSLMLAAVWCVDTEIHPLESTSVFRKIYNWQEIIICFYFKWPIDFSFLASVDDRTIHPNIHPINQSNHRSS